MDRFLRGDPPGILTLVNLIDEHQAALEFDFRARFHASFKSVFAEGGWGETFRLTMLLLQDPNNWITARVNGWEYPISREDMVIRQLYDLQHASKVKKTPKPLPRPWPMAGAQRYGKTKLSLEKVRAILRANRNGTLEEEMRRNG